MDMDVNHMHQPSSDSTTNNSPSPMAMSMPAIFTTETRITLFFTMWETKTLTAYILTLFFIFMLAILNRFLGALRFQLEKKWTESPARKSRPSLPSLSVQKVRYANTRLHKERLSPLPTYKTLDINDDDDDETRKEDYSSEFNPLSYHRGNEDDSDEDLDSYRAERRTPRRPFQLKHFTRFLPFPNWEPSAPWSWQRDGIRSFLEFCRALIGYILMLAVMTFNVGIFCVVLAGILISELALGRYSQVSSGWQEGGCHDG